MARVLVRQTKVKFIGLNTVTHTNDVFLFQKHFAPKIVSTSVKTKPTTIAKCMFYLLGLY